MAPHAPNEEIQKANYAPRRRSMTLDKAIVIILLALGNGSLVWIQLHSNRSVKKSAAEEPKED
jgi:hypothetical protein